MYVCSAFYIGVWKSAKKLIYKFLHGNSSRDFLRETISA